MVTKSFSQGHFRNTNHIMVEKSQKKKRSWVGFGCVHIKKKKEKKNNNNKDMLCYIFRITLLTLSIKLSGFQSTFKETNNWHFNMSERLRDASY